MTMGTYHGRPEKDPGKMIYRHKGSFSHEEDAKGAAAHLRSQGKEARVVTYTDGYSLYVLAPHDFWGKSFIHKVR